MITSFKDQYRWLSNFWPCVVKYDGKHYPSVENAYQAAKFPIELRTEFQFDKPGEAKRRAKRLIKQVLPTWQANRISVMATLLEQKFKHGSVLGSYLIGTGDELLIEGNTWGDTFWGQCNGVGENHLGILLMIRRKELIEGAVK